MHVRNYEMPFGKHKGCTLEDIHRDNPKYLDWLYDHLDDSNNIIRKKIEEYLSI